MVTWVSDLRQFLNHQRVKLTFKSVHSGLKALFSLPAFVISRVCHSKSLFSLTHFFLCGLSSVCVSLGQFDWLSGIMRASPIKVRNAACCASMLPTEDSMTTDYACANF